MKYSRKTDLNRISEDYCPNEKLENISWFRIRGFRSVGLYIFGYVGLLLFNCSESNSRVKSSAKLAAKFFLLLRQSELDAGKF